VLSPCAMHAGDHVTFDPGATSSQQLSPPTQDAMRIRRHSLALLPFALALAAADCKNSESRAKAPAVIAKAPDPWFLDSNAHCQFDSTANHPTAEGLVREFVQRDGQGAFMKSDSWFTAAVECPGREASSAEYSIVDGADVQPLRMNTDSARVGVRYRLLGVADANGFRPDLRTVTETLAVNRSRFGWRLASPAPAPHVLVDIARKRQAFTRADQWAIDAVVTQARRLAPRQ